MIRFFLSIFCMVLMGCSDPHDQVLGPDPQAWARDEELLEAVTELPADEQELLKQYIARKLLGAVFSGSPAVSPMGVTIGDAIREQEAWAAQQAEQAAQAAALAERTKAEQAARRSAMMAVATVAVISTRLLKSNYRAGRYRDSIGMDIAFSNDGDKDIAGLKGALSFADLFGDPIKAIRVSYDQDIPAGESSVWNAEVEYNQFRDEDNKLAATPLDKLQVGGEPDTVLFQDGTSMTLD